MKISQVLKNHLKQNFQVIDTDNLLKFNSKDLKIGNIVILQQKSKIDFLSHFKKKSKNK